MDNDSLKRVHERVNSPLCIIQLEKHALNHSKSYFDIAITNLTHLPNFRTCVELGVVDDRSY